MTETVADPVTDPFDTTALRESVLAAWRDSPTRFREDANAEDDLRVGGYRDRLVVELAQNAADAAAAESVPGELWLRVVDTPSGRELRAANTGAALDRPGVAALASLRASAKRSGNQVGRFGVGFAAVLAVSDAPRLVSTSGGVEFSARRTRSAVLDHERLAAVLAERSAEVPVLRLVWPANEEPPPDGFRSEVRLPLRPGVDADAVLAEAAATAEDLLLALPGLVTIRVGDRRWHRTALPDGTLTVRGPEGTSYWVTVRRAGTLPTDLAGLLGAEVRMRPEWAVCWALPVDADGAPVPHAEDVLHAPTPTDERLSLPVRLFATLPVEPSRRRLLPGPATDAVLAEAADAYLALLRRTAPEHRPALVPLPGFPLSEVDDKLRESLSALLSSAAWLPAQRSADGDLPPTAAVVLDVPDSELGELLADVVPDLLAWWLAGTEHARALAALGVRRLRPADLVAAVSGLDRPPSWWAELYAALDRLPDAGSSLADELGGLPVPLVDGRTALGPRDVLLPSPELGALLAGADVPGLRVAHPDAAHPLLERLGARPSDPRDLLDSPALRESVERALGDVRAGLDGTGLAGVVLRLVSAAGVSPGEAPWLAALPLPDSDGEPRRADELLLPDAALLAVLDDDVVGEDAPLGVLADGVAEEWPADALRAVGVLDSFALVEDEEPTAPDHGLADEDEWWDWRDADTLLIDPTRRPVTLLGVRDLDLVAEDAWPDALRLLAAEPRVRRALAEPGGYVGWWLSRYAVLAGRPAREWRLPSATALEGLYDAVPDLDLPEDLLATIGLRDRLAVADEEQATELVERLADPDREVPVALAVRAHGELATALADGVFDAGEVDPPEFVRALSGGAERAEDAVVLDRPWLLAVLPEARVLAWAGPDGPQGPADDPGDGPEAALAELLNLDLASEVVDATPDGPGEPVAWAELGAVRLACALLDLPVPDGTVLVHDELAVGGTRVAWWVSDGLLHAEDSPEGLARALAWTTGRWADRWRLAALIADPSPTTALG